MTFRIDRQRAWLRFRVFGHEVYISATFTINVTNPEQEARESAAMASALGSMFTSADG